jgi:hypothetical protein
LHGFGELQRQPTRYGCHGQGIVPATTAGFNGSVDKKTGAIVPARARRCGGTSGKDHDTACFQGVNSETLINKSAGAKLSKHW